MKNLWIRHLEKTTPEDRGRGTSFVKMLHSLAGEGGKEKRHLSKKASMGRQSGEGIVVAPVPQYDSQPPADRNKCEQISWKELCKWTAKSQQGYETGIDATKEDYVQLLLLESGKLMLRYNVTGEEIFETEVDSPEEAESLILEDNMTTANLYPDKPEFQWSKK